jgi:signal transduction histidine kinase
MRRKRPSGAADRRLRLGRLESLAALAGGVTHELSNLAASTMMSVQLLAPCCRDDADRSVLASLEQLGGRIQHAGRQLHWLARGVAGEPMLFQPQYLLADLQKLAAVAFPPSIAVFTRYPPDLRPLAGEPLLVFQLLLALALEARDHLPDGGSLVLAARNETVEASVATAAPVTPGTTAAAHVLPRPPGSYVVLEALAEPAAAGSPVDPAGTATPPAGRVGSATTARNRRRRADLQRLAGATGARLEALATPGGRRYHGRRAWLPAADAADLQ